MSGTKTSISRVYYEEIDNIDPKEMGEFYFHYNHFNLNESMRNDYENYEENQIKMRNKIISDAMKRNDIPSHPIVNSILFGVSSIKNKTVLIVEY